MFMFIGYAVAILIERGEGGHAALPGWPLVPLGAVELLLWVASARESRRARVDRGTRGHQ